MKILVINCHPDNRGDEAAVHAMVDEISAAYPGVEITLAIHFILVGDLELSNIDNVKWKGKM